MLTLTAFLFVLAGCVVVGGVGLVVLVAMVALGSRRDLRLTTRPSVVGSRPVEGP